MADALRGAIGPSIAGQSCLGPVEEQYSQNSPYLSLMLKGACLRDELGD